MLRQRFRTLGVWFQDLGGSTQSALIAVVVGLTSGLAAVGLTYGLETIHHWSEHQTLFPIGLFPLVGLPLTVITLKYLFRDFGGHGVPEVILSVTLKGGKLRARSGISKIVGNLITLSSGGSAGPEAPVVISGSAIGSTIARWFRSNEAVRVAVTGAGAAAAIASIFNAPIAGMIFTQEVILADWSARTMVPVALASVTGTVVSRLLHGNRIPFAHQKFIIGLSDIAAAALFSLFLALLVVLFMRTLRFSGERMKKWLGNDLLRSVVAGALLVGIISFFPQVRGEGYAIVRGLISNTLSMPILLLFALLLFKMLATGITLGGGGEGGVFAPSLVLGAMAGAFFHALLRLLFPSLTLASGGLFALLGMAGVISGAMQAPLSGMFLIFEITGGYEAILPLVLVSFLTPMWVRLAESHSIYHADLASKGLLRRPRTDARIVSDISLDEILETDIAVISPLSTLRQLIPLIQQSRRNLFVVEDPLSGNYLGLVEFQQIKTYIFDEQLAGTILIEQVMTRDAPTVSRQEEMVNIIRSFDTPGVWTLAVLDGSRFVGLISKSSLLDHYRHELKVQTQR
jgi:CIC family chloride channel protein